MKLLKFENVTFGYRVNKLIFKDLSFEISQPIGKGFVIGLMGCSGSGKSTILKLILGIEKNYKGSISIVPENPVISYLPQEPVLFDHLNAIENAEYFKRINNHKLKFNNLLFNDVAKALQIEDILHQFSSINELSGGQKQRISLLRALSIKPDILLLDEPLTGLDEEVKDQFLQTLATLSQKFGLMVIYVTHHRKEAEFISDVILYLEKAKNKAAVNEVCYTKPSLFFTNPPTVSALNATKEIHVNTLQFIEGENGLIIPIDNIADTGNSNILLMSFLDKAIEFSDNTGFEFEIIAITGTFTLLKLINTQIVFTIDNKIFAEKHRSIHRFIFLSGNVNLYNNSGQFIEMLEIQNNHIINKQ